MKTIEARFAPEELKGAADDTLTLMIEQGQAKLKAQLDLAQNADRRAQGLLTVNAGFGSAAIAFAVASFRSGEVAMAVGAGFATLGWIIAGAIAVLSMSPAKMNTPGWDPKWFVADILGGKDHKTIVSEALKFLDISIAENRQQLAVNGALTKMSMALIIVAPLVGAVAAVIAGGQGTN